MEEVLKDLISRLKDMPDNPRASARVERLEAFLAESTAELERSLDELREDQAKVAARQEEMRTAALARTEDFRVFEDAFLAEVKRGNGVLARIVGD
jgi:hypothetical protein